jgi:hypothetical protein
VKAEINTHGCLVIRPDSIAERWELTTWFDESDPILWVGVHAPTYMDTTFYKGMEVKKTTYVVCREADITGIEK